MQKYIGTTEHSVDGFILGHYRRQALYIIQCSRLHDPLSYLPVGVDSTGFDFCHFGIGKQSH